MESLNPNINSSKSNAILTDDYYRIIADSLKSENIIDLNIDKYNKNFPDFKYDNPYPKKQRPKKKNFIADLLDIGKMSEQEAINKKYISDCEKYICDKKAAVKRYLLEKRRFEERKEEAFVSLEYLRYYYEKSEKSAIEKYCNMILDESKYPEGLDFKYQISYNYGLESLSVDLLLPRLEVFPKKKSDEGTNLTVDIREAEIKSIYEKVILSIGIRTAKELFEINYNPKIKHIVLNAFVPRDYTIYSEKSSDFKSYARCLYGFCAEKEQFMKLDFNDRTVMRMSGKLNIMRIKNFNDMLEVMAPVKLRQE